MEKSSVSALPKCRICYKRHTLRDCQAFYNMDVSKRRQEVKEKRFCFKCLCSSHTREWCRSRKTCMVCNSNHHTLLHVDDHNKPRRIHQKHASKSSHSTQRLESNRRSSTRLSLNANQSRRHATAENYGSQRAPPLVHERLSRKRKVHVFLPTALARLLTPGGPAKVRLMLNSASLRTYVLRSMVQRYHLPTTRKNGEEFCTLSMQSYYDSAMKIQITGAVQRRLEVATPETTEDKQLQSVYNHIADLADPHFYNPIDIEVVIGNDQISKILLAGLIQTSSSMPIAQSSIFGWVISGAYSY
ncbi:uncharacterized protein LOC142219675 [Haematobia irritans]|uniref:uncharacterized protein LOC142219675 n=1 Tax=Haematobia irritans TaxID=7368 RepID=UPI003F4FAD09